MEEINVEVGTLPFKKQAVLVGIDTCLAVGATVIVSLLDIALIDGMGVGGNFLALFVIFIAWGILFPFLYYFIFFKGFLKRQSLRISKDKISGVDASSKMRAQSFEYSPSEIKEIKPQKVRVGNLAGVNRLSISFASF